MKSIINDHTTPYQLKLPLEISIIIDMDDPIYTFNEVMDHIDLRSYVAEEGCNMGRPRCDSVKLLKIILFAFMEGGYETLRNLSKLFPLTEESRGTHTDGEARTILSCGIAKPSDFVRLLCSRAESEGATAPQCREIFLLFHCTLAGEQFRNGGLQCIGNRL